MILVDINILLPNGKQVTKYLKKKNSGTKITVIMTNDDFDIVRSMCNLEVNDYLLKPVKKCILTDTIRKTLAFDEGENEKSRALKQKVSIIINDCDYTQWHNFILDTLNGTRPVDMIGEDERKDAVGFLEIVSQYITTEGEKLMPTDRKVVALIKDINQYGTMESRHFRAMIGLLTISEELLDHALKGYTDNIDFIGRAKFHVEKNIFRDLTLDDMATRSFVSTCYSSRTFRRIIGFGLSNYIATRKITIAKPLLRFNNLQINTIALGLAYQDSNYSCRIFKKDTGMTSSDYRRVVSPGVTR